MAKKKKITRIKSETIRQQYLQQTDESLAEITGLSVKLVKDYRMEHGLGRSPFTEVKLKMGLVPGKSNTKNEDDAIKKVDEEKGSSSEKNIS